MRKEERLSKSSKAEDRDNTQEMETCEDEERSSRLSKSSKAEDRDNTQEMETCEDEERRET